MSKQFKRIFALLLVLAMVFSAMPTAFASGVGVSGRADAEHVYTEEENALLDNDVFAKIEAVKANAASTMGGIGNMTEENYISLIPEVIAAIKSSETYVPGTLQQNGNFLVWMTTIGIPCCYSPRMEAELHNTVSDPTPEEIARVEADAQSMLEIGATRGGTPSSIKIGLIQPFWASKTNYIDGNFNASSPNYQSMWKKLYTATGGSGMRYTLTNATVDNIAKTIQECGLVLIDSHGDTDYINPNDPGDCTSRANTSYLLLTTSSGITAADTKKRSGPFDDYYDCLKGDGYTYVNGQCIANHMTKNAPHSLVYMGFCYSMATNGMYKALRAKGVEVAYGYSQEVTFGGDREYMLSMMDYVKDSYSFGQAVTKTKSALGNWDPAYSHLTLAQAKANRVAFPIVVSSEDAYPGHGKVDAVQTVKSTWTLYRDPVGFLPLLKQGGSQNTSLRVKTLQRMLIAKGYSCGSSGADGSFGSGTKSGVIKFQKAKGLTQDGIVGKNTWTALLKACQIQSGAKGDLVKLLQQILISLGYSCGSSGADGDFGSGTRSAVLKFQKEMGLSQDGIVGKDTWTRLLLAYFY